MHVGVKCLNPSTRLIKGFHRSYESLVVIQLMNS